jgi:hypothetical protein
MFYIVLRNGNPMERTMNTRPMSFSDRQHFIQCLAETRNLSIACARGEHSDSELRRRCETLTAAIDGVVGELVGDESYLALKDPSRHWG